MLTRPGQLSDAALAQALAAGWGITPATMEYRAVGYGSWRRRASACRVPVVVVLRGHPRAGQVPVRAVGHECCVVSVFGSIWA
jgi:hypothetical protein